MQLKRNKADDPMYPSRHTKVDDNYGFKGIYSCWTQSKFVEQFIWKEGFLRDSRINFLIVWQIVQKAHYQRHDNNTFHNRLKSRCMLRDDMCYSFLYSIEISTESLFWWTVYKLYSIKSFLYVVFHKNLTNY